MTFQRQASPTCILFLAWGFGVAFGEERCRVAGGGSCVDPASRALLSETTASMLQLKASSNLEELLEKQVPAAKAALPRESDVEEAAAALEEGVETQMGAAAQNAISGIEAIGSNLVEAEQEIERTAPAQIDEMAAEATEVVGEQIETAKAEGLHAVQGVSNAATKKIDSVADSVQGKLSEAELEIQRSQHVVNAQATELVHEADQAIDTTVELLKETVESVAPNEKVKNDMSNGLDKAVRPYVVMAKKSLEAKKEKVNAVLSEISRQTGYLGEEFQGIARQAAQDTRSGVNTAVAGV